MYDVHDMFTMPPRVEEAELPEVESPEDGAYARKEAVLPGENEDRRACKRVPTMVTLPWLVPKLQQYVAVDQWENYMGQGHPETEEAKLHEEEAIATAEDWLDPPEREGVAAAVKDRLNLQRQEGVVATAKEWLDPPEQESTTAEDRPVRRGQLETVGKETETDKTGIVMLETVGTETDKTRIITLETVDTETDNTRVVKLETVEMRAETDETEIVELETARPETDETGIVKLETGMKLVTETDETVVELETVRPETGETGIVESETGMKLGTETGKTGIVELETVERKTEVSTGTEFTEPRETESRQTE